ncbi:MAG: hypothetical protein PHO41_05375 [Eubacteriales bacterium]|nr:hypothetical protein [Eubacteriales bacterium]
MKHRKKAAGLALFLALLFALAACTPKPTAGEGTDAPALPEASEKTVQPDAPTDAAEASVALPETVDVSNGYGYEAFITLAATAEAQGDACAEKGHALQAYTFYAASACTLGSLRFGIENIIAAKTGALTEDVFAGSLYTSWEELAALFPASPYPDYFEGLARLGFGEEAAAVTCWTNAAANAAYPEEGLAFTYLLEESAETLTTLRNDLRVRENALLAKYEPELYEIERSPKNSFVEYLLGITRQKLEEKSYGEAMEYARAAVLLEPFSGDCFTACAVCAMVGSDGAAMAYYINEGLLIDPAHTGLQTLLKAYEAGGAADE